MHLLDFEDDIMLGGMHCGILVALDPKALARCILSCTPLRDRGHEAIESLRAKQGLPLRPGEPKSLTLQRVMGWSYRRGSVLHHSKCSNTGATLCLCWCDSRQRIFSGSDDGTITEVRHCRQGSLDAPHWWLHPK